MQAVAGEETNTFLISGDSAGYLKVWDISEMLDSREAGGPIRRETISLLFAWRGHVAAVSRLEYLKGIEGVVSASTDCTVRLWTLSGQQVGLFGQEARWSLSERATWLDPACCTLDEHRGEKTSDDKTVASEQRLRVLLPQTAATLGSSTFKVATRDAGSLRDPDGRIALRSELEKAKLRSRGQSAELAHRGAEQLKPPEWRRAAERASGWPAGLSKAEAMADRALHAKHTRALVASSLSRGARVVHESHSLPRLHGGGSTAGSSRVPYRPKIPDRPWQVASSSRPRSGMLLRPL